MLLTSSAQNEPSLRSKVAGGAGGKKNGSIHTCACCRSLPRVRARLRLPASPRLGSGSLVIRYTRLRQLFARESALKTIEMTQSTFSNARSSSASMWPHAYSPSAVFSPCSSRIARPVGCSSPCCKYVNGNSSPPSAAFCCLVPNRSSPIRSVSPDCTRRCILACTQPSACASGEGDPLAPGSHIPFRASTTNRMASFWLYSGSSWFSAISAYSLLFSSSSSPPSE
mmetsp:Transcript_17959/g.44963  ORF Transcript_17959/g.44963 Transcript_17959/m.44963 type:complete len:226 (+) Transcript_17959:22-699(+)